MGSTQNVKLDLFCVITLNVCKIKHYITYLHVPPKYDNVKRNNDQHKSSNCGHSEKKSKKTH